MPRNKELQHIKRLAVLHFYRELDGLQEFGVKKHTTAWCLAKTGERFFLSPRSIERYVYNT